MNARVSRAYATNAKAKTQRQIEAVSILLRLTEKPKFVRCAPDRPCRRSDEI